MPWRIAYTVVALWKFAVGLSVVLFFGYADFLPRWLIAFFSFNIGLIAAWTTVFLLEDNARRVGLNEPPTPQETNEAKP
jgi:hypothetical protein